MLQLGEDLWFLKDQFSPGSICSQWLDVSQWNAAVGKSQGYCIALLSLNFTSMCLPPLWPMWGVYRGTEAADTRVVWWCLQGS